MRKLTNVFSNLYYLMTDGLPNHYSYKLEGFSKKNDTTHVIYRISGNRQILQSPLSDFFEEETYLNNFSPPDVKRITLEHVNQQGQQVVITEAKPVIQYKLLYCLCCQ